MKMNRGLVTCLCALALAAYGSQANAQGFIDEWANAGWTIDFNWGDGNAWESDWTSNDDNYVDNADFVFYTGHANMNGWVLANTGGDGFSKVYPPEMGVDLKAVYQGKGDEKGKGDGKGKGRGADKAAAASAGA